MAQVQIRQVEARICFDSRGSETVEVEVAVDKAVGRSAAPAGASVGRFEAVAFPDGGARAAVALIARFASKLVGLPADDPRQLRDVLRQIDGTSNYSRIGGATAYAVSVAAAEAAARARGQPLFRLLMPARGSVMLPYPLGNVLGGGKHAGRGAPDIQELLVCPIGAKTIQDALAANAAVHRQVRKEIEARDPYFPGGKGDEGAWAPRVTDDEAFKIVDAAVHVVSERLGMQIRLAADFAASSLWDAKRNAYNYSHSGTERSPGEQLEYVVGLVERYKLLLVEDPLHEEAFAEFAELARRLPGVLIVGDDLLVTNAERLRKAAMMGAANGAILKVNQAGALGDALDFAAEARRLGYPLVTSHRSGDTPDAHIAHIAVATGSVMLKSGVVGGERVAKLNELLRISERLRRPEMSPVLSL